MEKTRIKQALAPFQMGPGRCQEVAKLVFFENNDEKGSNCENVLSVTRAPKFSPA